MFKIRIRSGKESQQNGGYQHDEYSGQEGYDDYGEYAGPQSRKDRDNGRNECCLCGDSITNGHLVFVIKGNEYEIHTSCMVTGMALITNGITLLAELFKKRRKDKQIKNEEDK